MSPRSAVLAAAVLAAGCAPLPPPTVLPLAQQPGYAGYASAKYADAHLWLCRPDLPADRCRVDLSATEVHPDGSRTGARSAGGARGAAAPESSSRTLQEESCAPRMWTTSIRA